MPKNILSLGIVIVVLGISVTIFLTKGPADVGSGGVVVIEAADHFLGGRSAPVKIVEYAEGECIYCKRLHPTLLRVVEESEGQVALVFRHFPLTTHPKSFTEAVALECVAEEKGDEGFFLYLEKLYEATPSNNNIDLAVLPRLSKEIGIEEGKFAGCLASDRYRARILSDIETGIGLNVDSVPHLIIVAPSGKEFVFSKSPSYAALRAVIETALGEN